MNSIVKNQLHIFWHHLPWLTKEETLVMYQFILCELWKSQKGRGKEFFVLFLAEIKKFNGGDFLTMFLGMARKLFFLRMYNFPRILTSSVSLEVIPVSKILYI